MYRHISFLILEEQRISSRLALAQAHRRARTAVRLPCGELRPRETKEPAGKLQKKSSIWKSRQPSRKWEAFYIIRRFDICFIFHQHTVRKQRTRKRADTTLFLMVLLDRCSSKAVENLRLLIAVRQHLFAKHTNKWDAITGDIRFVSMLCHVKTCLSWKRSFTLWANLNHEDNQKSYWYWDTILVLLLDACILMSCPLGTYCVFFFPINVVLGIRCIYIWSWIVWSESPAIICNRVCRT